MSRNQLITILKINGFAEDAKESDIRKVLLNAHYSESEIETALITLKNSTPTQTSHVDGLHSVFYTDGNLRPSEVSSLLGIDINISAPISSRSKRGEFGGKEFFVIVAVGIFLAGLIVLFYMYLVSVGVFHPSVTL